MRRRLLSIAFATTTLFASVGVARADEQVSAHLSYATDAGIERCPSTRELTDAVAARVGYDAFAKPESQDTIDVVVTVKRRKEGVVGKLVLGGPHGGEREIESSDCREVVDALAVAIAIGIDPRSLAKPPEPPPPAPPPPIQPPPAPPPEKPAPPPTPIQVRVMAGANALFGELPGTSAAIVLGASIRWKWIEPTIEGFGSFAASQNAYEGKVEGALDGAVLAPCIHVDALFGCFTLTLAAFHGEGRELAMTNDGDGFYAAIGARIGGELRLVGPLFARITAEADVPTTRFTLQVDGRGAWTSPRIAARLGLSLGVKIFE